VDYSKNLVTDEVLTALFALASGRSARAAMFAGEHINVTEDRAVLHTALRLPRDATLVVDGQDVVADVHEVLDRMGAFATGCAPASGPAHTGERIKTVVNIGIGGSDLGPGDGYEALKAYATPDLECRFVSNIDPTDLSREDPRPRPGQTLFVVVSKTFGTQETLTNATEARNWLLAGPGRRRRAVAKHFVAVSHQRRAGRRLRHRHRQHVRLLGLGRRPLLAGLGDRPVGDAGDRPEQFAEMLAGFHAMDEHFRTAPLENVPVLLGLLNVWYDTSSAPRPHAVLPYSQYLHRFPPTCSS
jgi:glucose-6-phosphate isomerase